MWDPLRKKEVAETPEEQVRQWFIGVLEKEMSVPRHQMMSEVGFTYGSKRFRADILVYDRALKPLAVVECKRPEVTIDAAVAGQALRYDIVLDVKFVILTNGKTTYIYGREGRSFKQMDSLPLYETMLCRQ